MTHQQIDRGAAGRLTRAARAGLIEGSEIVCRLSEGPAMYESSPQAGAGDEGHSAEQQLEREMAEFLRATETFIASWSEAIRCFADGPAVSRQFRVAPDTTSRRRRREGESRTIGIASAIADLAHPLWDRELDG